ncbi:MAG: sialate O-acetylesterase [Treponema sp.]|nr:sialate O-acetylesterase [Treponema sp.]
MTDFTVAAVFSNNCVLQRNKNISIFGTAESNSDIVVTLSTKNDELATNSSKAINGRWLVQLPPQVAQQDCKLKITCENKTIEFTNIAIGEVWLAGGQSNMEFELQNCTEAAEELNNPEVNPNVRFYYTNKIGWKDDAFYEAEKNTCWQTWDSEWKKSWSAVGYFFGKQLSQDLDVTVGIIGCNWGGTSASAWMRKEYLEVDSELKTYLDEQEEATKGKSIQQQLDEYDAYVKANDEWQEKCNELYRTVPGIEWDEIQQRIGPTLWPGPKSCKNPYRPTGLYDCMLSRILPYTLNGFIWYQGESDDHKPAMYYKLFSRMIDNWRTDWQDNSLPFIFVQLPAHRYKQDKDFKHWCFIREAQEKVHRTIKNAWMTCALDLGQYNDIHPKAKRTLGQRMAKIALSKVYEVSSNTAISPILAYSIAQNDCCTKNGKMILTFENAEQGFEVRADEEEFNYYKQMEENQNNTVPADFTGFEVAGTDGNYYPAKFTLGDGVSAPKNTIVLCSEKVASPVFARYAWFNYGPVTIFCKNGLPLAPFRTSSNDSAAASEHAAIQQIMEV